MQKSWLQSYPACVPAEINPHIHASLADLLETSCARFALHPALTCLGGKLSFADLERLSGAFASFLQNELALERGERVAIMLPNLLQYPIALFGVLRAGLIAVPVNPLYMRSELAHQLANSGATAIVVLENFAHTLEQALPTTGVRHVVVTGAGDLLPFGRRELVNATVKYVRNAVPRWRLPNAWCFRAALAHATTTRFRPLPIGREDIALLQYTGGTTGEPKGAMLTHGNLLANVEQIAAWMSPVLRAGTESVITALPLYHIFALTANLLVFLKLGGCNVLIPDARDIARLVRELGRVRYTAITGVNTLYKALLAAPGFAQAAAATRGILKIAVAGGMSVERSVAEQWHAATGIALMEGYGLTEASPVVCANRLDAKPYTGKLGLPLPSTEVAILDDAGNPVAEDTIGEICVKGPQVMGGYWEAPHETAKAFTPNGWLRTGDMGSMDAAGYVLFAERRKDVIVVSGFKAYPTEIEAVVTAHPGVKDASAVGIPDSRTGEAVALFVVKKDPELTTATLHEHCARHLTGYKRPKHIEFRASLPKSPLGKTLRRELVIEVATSGHEALTASAAQPSAPRSSITL